MISILFILDLSVIELPLSVNIRILSLVLQICNQNIFQDTDFSANT